MGKKFLTFFGVFWAVHDSMDYLYVKRLLGRGEINVLNICSSLFQVTEHGYPMKHLILAKLQSIYYAV